MLRNRYWVWICLAALGLGLTQSCARAQDGPPVEVLAIPQRADVAAGDQLVIAVVLNHAEHFHTWPSADQDVLEPSIAASAQRTAIDVQLVQGGPVQVGPIQWPTPFPATVPDPSTGEPVQAHTYQGRAVAFVPIKLGSGLTGSEVHLRIMASYQACDDTVCMQPEDVELSVRLPIRAAGAVPAALADSQLFAGFHAAVFDTGLFTPLKISAPSDAAAAPRQKLFGFITVPSADSAVGIVILVLLGALGGFVLNLTPCVLPVIPIKVLTLTQHAATPGRALYLGVWMALGVVAFWIAVSLPWIFFNIDPSQVFGIWWVTLGIGVVIGIMALGMLGLFQITLPQSLYAINPKADTAKGSFIFGVMTAVLGLPCFGFIVGALLAATAGAPKVVIVALFASLGAGMALPYLVLAAYPKLVDRIPRSGPASDLVKQVMALLLLAAAAFFIGAGLLVLVAEKPYLGPYLPWWVAALLCCSAGLWLVVRTFMITKRPVMRVSMVLAALLVGGVAVLWAANLTRGAKHSYEILQAELAAEATKGGLSTEAWINYTPALFEQARRENYIVVLDFTAPWCLICKGLKARVLYPDPVASALRKGDVVTMTVDLPSRKSPGWKTLRDLGQTGIPLLAVYTPGQEKPWLANSYTSSMVLEALGKARLAREQAGHGASASR